MSLKCTIIFAGELNVTFPKLLNANVQLCNVSVLLHQTRVWIHESIHKFVGIWTVLFIMTFSFWHQETKTTPNEQHLTTARLQTGCSQEKWPLSLKCHRVSLERCNRDAERLGESQKELMSFGYIPHWWVWDVAWSWDVGCKLITTKLLWSVSRRTGWWTQLNASHI